ncbi:MAG: hypothetical protein FWE06_04555 [Oscillospiraceae bacterium]|nr:hypothetical protein [Oscillospiraceae bacterium]
MYMKIEDIINEVLMGEARKNALDFVEYLQTNGAQFSDSDNFFWNPTFNEKALFTINIAIYNDGAASFDTFINILPSAWENESAAALEDERTKEILWANVRPCVITDCKNCSPGYEKIILGKEFNNLCGCFLGIYGPDAETFTCMKKIFDGIKSDIIENA